MSLTDALAAGVVDLAQVHIVIEVDRRPDGFMSVDGGPPIAIAGWTELLVALGEILSPPPLGSSDLRSDRSTRRDV